VIGVLFDEFYYFGEVVWLVCVCVVVVYDDVIGECVIVEVWY